MESSDPKAANGKGKAKPPPARADSESLALFDRIQAFIGGQASGSSTGARKPDMEPLAQKLSNKMTEFNLGGVAGTLHNLELDESGKASSKGKGRLREEVRRSAAPYQVPTPTREGQGGGGGGAASSSSTTTTTTIPMSNPPSK